MIDTARTALLVIDVQRAIVDRFGFGPDYLRAVVAAVGAARAAAVRMIYLRVAFRPGAPEVGAHPSRFAAFARSMSEEDPASAVHPDLAPHPANIVITRRRPNAFTGTGLDLVLRAGGIDHLVLTGNATSGGVLATLLAAVDRDLRLTVLSDGCADFDDAVHAFLVDRIFPVHAEVTTVENWRGLVVATPSAR